MSLLIQSWCAGDLCDPCKPITPPPVPPSGVTIFTAAEININEVQISTDLHGNSQRGFLGSMIIWSPGAGINQGSFGPPLAFGPQSSTVSSVVVFESFITITHPYYAPGSYNDTLPTVSTGLLQPTLSPNDGSQAANQAATIATGNVAIAQANTILTRGYL